LLAGLRPARDEQQVERVGFRIARAAGMCGIRPDGRLPGAGEGARVVKQGEAALRRELEVYAEAFHGMAHGAPLLFPGDVEPAAHRFRRRLAALPQRPAAGPLTDE